jgi:glutamate synthase domain-containing protein 1/glutamate synthase domain-containing protein 3
MSPNNSIEKILGSRKSLIPENGLNIYNREDAAEGGCGVIGIACSEKIAGRHLLQSLTQMRNRGNGKGGGIAAVGLDASQFGVSPQVLEEDYLLTVAYLDPSVRTEVEDSAIIPTFRIDHTREQPHIEDYRALNGLDVRPPEVVYYFVSVRPEFSAAFREEHNLSEASQREVEDEVVYQNTFRLNTAYYASTGETRAFVLSHGKNLLVLKMVGYGDDVVRYYQLEGLHAHIWIGHHRYPTKGRVWHPGGAHPFIGMNEALVHNGDFANYAAVSEFLAQRNIYPLFLTDTEVSVQVFDLLHRTFGYPLEYVIESLAPTTERDYTKLPEDKKALYRMLQATHMHGSPDGPWFFLIAQSAPQGTTSKAYRLIGITDTSMLRPQVFALQQATQDGPAIGFAASEKQGIDAALESLAAEDPRFWSRADKYWNARGGSHTDGGAFIFSIQAAGDNPALHCTNKFGEYITVETHQPPNVPAASAQKSSNAKLPEIPVTQLFDWFKEGIQSWTYSTLELNLKSLAQIAATAPKRAIEVLTRLMDRRYPTGTLRRSSLLSIYDQTLNEMIAVIRGSSPTGLAFIDVETDLHIHHPEPVKTTLLIEARGFPIEGPDSLALRLVALYKAGYRQFLIANARGHRFIGNGFGTGTQGVRIDVYGSSGDYLASGLDGIEIQVHGSGQDQLCQIMKSGKLVVHGDVGQTFGYAAKGGEVYILGNAAGRPMINAVGKPRVVINGTCLDYLAESFMAGDPLNGGGFIILNGLGIDSQGRILELPDPYPGGNLFSLASGGAIFVRDPQNKLTADQLNGGEFAPFGEADWQAILPYLEENQRQFGISFHDLLNGRPPGDVYRKIQPVAVRALQAEEAWVHKNGGRR